MITSLDVGTKGRNMEKLKTLFIACLLTATGSASAVPITGSIGFTGDYTVLGGTSLADATGIDIIGDDATVTGTVDGSFADAGITSGDVATYNDFSIGIVPIDDLWSIGDFSFDLATMVIEYQSSNLLALSGTGIISSTDSNLDATAGGWTFTANSFGSNFTFSSSTGSSGSVPEPASVLLMSIGLIGIGVFRKLRNSI
jgi:hypothetical protein